MTSVAELLAVLSRSHERLGNVLAGLTDAELAGPSYDDGWTIAQVASHLGSSAEIFAAILEAGLQGSPAPGSDQFAPVWERWNAKPPAAQAADALQFDGAFLDRIEALPADDARRWHMHLFGAEQDLAGLLSMRLSEHALHTWDIVVALDPSATVSDDAVAIIVDSLPALVGYTGRPARTTRRVLVTTREPERSFLLTVDPEGARLEPGADESAERLVGPAEAFVRLVYGRLDPAHTPASVDASATDLAELRRTFPGL